ncbi:hypothetical protein IU501_35425 [Nocardia otitidiscaviarum]|uniref:hypothetical protein n=1 Tax=Nocardia otitidiscaviarum TaxID=1823 RepID=UPI001895DC7B|nr:hypothetical protein [Nocardia otitidiscaviarum]MBF6138266.1 hypothetical protein [Nocardia otitidiscaviarum]
MPTELHHPDSSPPPELLANRAADQPTPDDATPVWTWPSVTVTCFLVLAALTFAGVLALTGTDPRIAGGIALVLVAGIVVCVLPSRRRSRSLVHRVADALLAFGGDGGQGGAR